MYEAHFRLQHRPFRSTTGSASYYPAFSHEMVLGRCAQAISDEEGLVLLMGLPGTGKTLICHRLLGQMSEETNQILLTNSHFADSSSLLQAMLYDLSLPYEGRSEQELRLILTDFLLNEFAAGRRTNVVVDEAHHLSPRLLEELRLWCNLEMEEAKAIQVVLAAQPSILETLRIPEMTTVSQRLATRLQLEPLSLEESAAYLLHQIRAAGGRVESIFADEAMEIICGAAKGLPRILNQACHQAFCVAFQAGTATVDAEAAIEAVEVLGLELEPESSGEQRFAPVVARAESPITLAQSGPARGDSLNAGQQAHKPRKTTKQPSDQEEAVRRLRGSHRRPA